MIQIVFSVCSIVVGAACKELPPIPLKPEVPLSACFMASQIEGAKWAARNPNFYIYRATCRRAGAFADI